MLSPQKALEVSQTNILGEISHYFWSYVVSDPVVFKGYHGNKILGNHK